MDELDGLDGRLAELERQMGGAEAVVSGFTRELSGLRGEMAGAAKDAAGLGRSFGSGLRRAFDGLAFDGAKLSDSLRAVAGSMVNAAYGAAMRPVQDAVGGAIAGMMPFADGAPFVQGRVTPFARGGVVTQATAFPMRGGTGLMGEAGPEAIMPLKRGPDGRLGVEAGAGGARAVSVTMNISTPDAEGFRRSRSQIAAEMSRALARGARNR